eukprot:2827767-Ditylum_brightwellii.AAC.1
MESAVASVGNITKAVFTDTKGFWLVETAKDKVVDVMKYAKENFDILEPSILREFQNQHKALSSPFLLNMNLVPAGYTANLIANMGIH